MEDFDYNGLDTAWNKYISLSYTMPTFWRIPFEKVAYILEPRTLHEDRTSDILLERLRIPYLINYVSEHRHERTISVLDSIHKASQLTQNYLDATAKAYKKGIKENVIEHVYYFYPWIRCFQVDTAIEVTFFTLIEYRNHRKVFKIVKLIPDDLSTDISILDYLEQVWKAPVPTIHIDSGIYSYFPTDDEIPEPNSTVICYNSIIQLFMYQNFKYSFNLSAADIGLIGVGQLVTADDKKPKRVARKLQKSTCYVSVTPSQFDDYFSYTYKSYLALANMETYRDIFFAYKRLCKAHHTDERKAQAKQAYERFLLNFAHEQGIRLDMSLEELVRQKNKQELLDVVGTFLGKICSELLPS